MMLCSCGGRSYVANVRGELSRDDTPAGEVRRTRVCRECGRRWMTVECNWTRPALEKTFANCERERETMKRRV